MFAGFGGGLVYRTHFAPLKRGQPKHVPGGGVQTFPGTIATRIQNIRDHFFKAERLRLGVCLFV
jgi:hypothetical protein